MKEKTGITIVTAFFNIGRGKIENDVSKNLKRGTDIYLSYFSYLAELDNDMIIFTEEKYKENGQIQDDYRIDFIKEHLTELHKGIEAGSNCFGYLIWTTIDCWSWLNAYKNRYGLIELDINTQERKIKKSGEWFKLLNENNGF